MKSISKPLYRIAAIAAFIQRFLFLVSFVAKVR